MKKPQPIWRWLLALTALVGCLPAAHAQVTVDPVFFTDTTPITLTFDATQGNGGLANYTGDVFIYTGVITNLSTSTGDWKHVANTTGYNNPGLSEKMTPIGNHKYTISFTPRTFYPGLSASTEVVQKLAMVFRGTGGTPEGKGPSGADIFVNVSQGAFQVAFTSPSSSPTVLGSSGASVTVAGTASAASTITLSLNGTQVAQQTNATSISTSVNITQPGVNTLTLTATLGTSTATTTTTYVIPPTPTVAALPAGAKADGITYLANGTSAILSLTAPNKSYVYVLGDFNNWQPTNATQMKQTSTVNSDAATGRWWVQIDNLTAGQEYAYQFWVDGTLRVADAYCDKVLDPYNDGSIPAITYPGLKAYPVGSTTGNVSVLQTGQTAYTWTATSFVRPARTNLVVYELLVRDFVARHDYQTLSDTLKYLQRLGVNAIELMPINEFDGNESWGYNPGFYFAPDKYYGTKNALKSFIDLCHSKGIAVIMDMVLNHSCGNSPMAQLYFNSSAGKPSSNNPWYNVDATHDYNVCYDFNHESAYTRYFSKNVMKYWLQEYHVDGYRFDLSKGFTQKITLGNVSAWGQYDQSRINIWTDYYNTIVATDATAYPILEHFADNSEDAALANIGLMPWGNMAYNYQQADMGFSSGWDLSYGYFGSRSQTYPNLMTYMESHDEERTMYKSLTFGNSSGSYSVKDAATALRREEMAAAIFFTQPGPRMIWQFEELGYDISIDQNGRTGNKPILWNYYQNANRRHLYDTYRALITLKKNAVFAPANYTAYSQNLSGAVKTISVSNATLGVVSMGNFDVVAQSANISFPKTGTWYNYLDGTTLTVSSLNMPMTLAPGQYAVYTSSKIAVPQGTTLASRPQETLAFKLSLAPNPASGTTTIAYELPTAATAAISVQNVLGQQVRTLVPAHQGAGAQAQSLSLQGLAPGVYLVKLQAGELTQTARLLVQ
ncbi:MAG: alpha-amylase family glycosyl hydrolase [Janthinobacterium lividum]